MGVSLDTALCGAVCKDNACRSASNAVIEVLEGGSIEMHRYETDAKKTGNETQLRVLE